MILRPSILPILAKSPKFVQGDTTVDTNEGTLRHELLEHVFAGREAMVFELGDEYQADSLKWAANQIRLLAPTMDYPVMFNVPLKIELEDWTDVSGTADVICDGHIFDLKWRERDYDHQMAAYALGWMQHNEGSKFPCQVHVLFGATRRVQSLEFDYETAHRMVADVVNKARTAKTCAVSQYCNWCAIRYECPIYTKAALAVAKNREDWPEPRSFHTSQLDDPIEVGKALRIARLMKGWIESVEYHALEMATKKGMVPEGYRLEQSEGKRAITNTEEAFKIANLEADEFLRCCEVRLSTSKTYPDRIGIIDSYAKAKGMKKAPAKRELFKLMDHIISRGKSTMKLVEGEAKPEEIEEATNA